MREGNLCGAVSGGNESGKMLGSFWKGVKTNMTVYGYVKKGIHHRDGVCQDTMMLGDLVMGEGSAKVSLPENFMLCVADGVGGMRAGDIASGIALSSLARLNCGEKNVEEVCGLIFQVNALIREIGTSSSLCDGMASTFVGFHMYQGKASVLWAGNSRLYQVTETNALQLTVDHNRQNDWLESGQMGHGRADALTVYLGMSESGLENRLGKEEVYLPGTRRIFITSDGVHDHIPEETLRALFLSGENEETLPERIAEEALENGSDDDISIILLAF